MNEAKGTKSRKKRNTFDPYVRRSDKNRNVRAKYASCIYKNPATYATNGQNELAVTLLQQSSSRLSCTRRSRSVRLRTQAIEQSNKRLHSNRRITDQKNNRRTSLYPPDMSWASRACWNVLYATLLYTAGGFVFGFTLKVNKKNEKRGCP